MKRKTRLCFFAFLYSGQLGIMRQVHTLRSSAERLDIPLDYTVFTVSVNASRLLKLIRMAQYALTILLQLPAKSYVILRYNPYDPFLLLLAILFRSRLHIVFHTLVEKEIASNSAIRLISDLLLKASLSVSGPLIAVTNEIGQAYSRYGKSYICMPNSIENLSLLDQSISSNSIREHYFSIPLTADVPQFVFIANRFSPWQGLDILFNSVSSATQSFKIHIVGNTMNQSSDDTRLIFHGTLDPASLNSVYACCSVGLSCFALYRKGMKEACPLKVREYLSYGLPVYAGHLDIFPSSFPFYRVGEPDMSAILSYYTDIKKYSRIQVRQASTPYIHCDKILSDLYATLS